MANDKDQKREGLDEFEARFGALSDRMEQAVHPYLDRDPMERAETSERAAEREGAEDQDGAQDGEFLPGHSVQEPFEQAVANAEQDSDKEQGPGSKMVEQDQPEHNLPPPENSEDQDRISHENRMSEDDRLAQRGQFSQEFYESLSQTLEEQGYEYDQGRAQHNDGQTQDYGQG